MTTPINPYAVPETPLQSFIDYSKAFAAAGQLEHSLIELVKTRASQINGCGVCLYLHTTEARKMGESELRIYELNAWRDSPLYSAREKAALAWTDALTHMDRRDMDEAYARVAEMFTPAEQVQLNLAIGIINVYNRLNAGFGVAHPVSADHKAAA